MAALVARAAAAGLAAALTHAATARGAARSRLAAVAASLAAGQADFEAAVAAHAADAAAGAAALEARAAALEETRAAHEAAVMQLEAAVAAHDAAVAELEASRVAHQQDVASNQRRAQEAMAQAGARMRRAQAAEEGVNRASAELQRREAAHAAKVDSDTRVLADASAALRLKDEEIERRRAAAEAAETAAIEAQRAADNARIANETEAAALSDWQFRLSARAVMQEEEEERLCGERAALAELAKRLEERQREIDADWVGLVAAANAHARRGAEETAKALESMNECVRKAQNISLECFVAAAEPEPLLPPPTVQDTDTPRPLAPFVSVKQAPEDRKTVTWAAVVATPAAANKAQPSTKAAAGRKINAPAAGQQSAQCRSPLVKESKATNGGGKTWAAVAAAPSVNNQAQAKKAAIPAVKNTRSAAGQKAQGQSLQGTATQAAPKCLPSYKEKLMQRPSSSNKAPAAAVQMPSSPKDAAGNKKGSNNSGNTFASLAARGCKPQQVAGGGNGRHGGGGCAPPAFGRSSSGNSSHSSGSGSSGGGSFSDRQARDNTIAAKSSSSSTPKKGACVAEGEWQTVLRQSKGHGMHNRPHWRI